jgi:hypothetical protein
VLFAVTLLWIPVPEHSAGGFCWAHCLSSWVYCPTIGMHAPCVGDVARGVCRRWDSSKPHQHHMSNSCPKPPGTWQHLPSPLSMLLGAGGFSNSILLPLTSGAVLCLPHHTAICVQFAHTYIHWAQPESWDTLPLR